MQKTSEGANIPGIRSVGKINQCVIITITEKTGLEFIFVDIYIQVDIYLSVEKEIIEEKCDNQGKEKLQKTTT